MPNRIGSCVGEKPSNFNGFNVADKKFGRKSAGLPVANCAARINQDQKKQI
jgi:hypothetical protein